MVLVSRRSVISTGATTGLAGGVAGLSADRVAPAAGVSGIKGGDDRFLRPEAFGAVADGQVDCTQAMLATIAAAAQGRTIGSRQIVLPIVLSPGVYRLTAPLVFSHTGMSFVGAGRQNTVLMLDHGGPGIVVDSGGDSEFRGMILDSTERRRQLGRGDGFVCVPKAGTSFTYFLTMIDFLVVAQPGNGIVLQSPEGLRMENVISGRNGGDGCLLDGTKLENICNKIDFVRFHENGGCGLNVRNIANSIFSRVECLNNRGIAQFQLSGNYNSILHTDCEGFNVYNGQSPCIGLQLSGKGNVVQSGNYFKVSTAIALRGATDSRIITPKFDGQSRLPIDTAIDIGPDCTRNTVDFAEGHFVSRKVRDQGSANRVTASGLTPLSDAAPTVLHQQASGTFVPDLSGARTISVVADGPLRIVPPENALPEHQFALLVDSQHHGIGALTFDAAYRGMAEAVVRNAAHRYLSCSFVVTADGRCLPHNVLSYD